MTSLPDAFAGAWTMPEGKGQVVITGTWSAAEKAYDGSETPQSRPRYTKFEMQSLIEYGATDRFTLMASPGLQQVDIDGADGGRRTGLGYSEFGGRHLLLQDDSWVLSGQATLRVPGTFQRANPAAVGYTDTEIDNRILIGRSLSVGGWEAFIDLQLAQRFRSGDPPDEFRADLTFGLRMAPRWQLLAQSFNVISEGAGTPAFPSYAYYKLQINAVYEATPAWAIQFGGFTTFTGRNALQENGIVLGATRKF